MQNAIKPLQKAFNPQQKNVSRFREVHPRFAAENNQSLRWRQLPQGKRFEQRLSVSPSSHFLSQMRQREGFGPRTFDSVNGERQGGRFERRQSLSTETFPNRRDLIFRVVVGRAISRVVIREITQNKTEHFHRGQFRTEHSTGIVRVFSLLG